MAKRISGLRWMHVSGMAACGAGACFGLLAWFFAAPMARAHDIPADVKLVAFFKPSAERLELLVRVPMQAMREVEVPTRGPGYLVVSRADEALRAVAKMWLTDHIEVLENGATLSTGRIARARISLPSDASFSSFEAARSHLEGPRLADDLDLYWNQQLLDVLIDYPITSDRSDFAIRLRFDRLALRVQTSLRFLPPEGPVRGYLLHGDAGLVHLDPRWHQSAWRFLAAGFLHILDGMDHLLFLACLVIPFRRVRPLVALVTSFTVAHSITLISAAVGFVPDALWFPPLVETLIAVTVLYMALENIVGASGAWRWVLAFAAGLVHGFGFAFALSQSWQFAGSHLLTALVSFNIGVEAGQLAVLIVLLPALALLFRHVVDERIGGIILSALVAHTAWHWMLERGGELAKFPWPKLDALFLAGLMRGFMAVLVLGAAVWLVSGSVRRWLRAAD